MKLCAKLFSGFIIILMLSCATAPTANENKLNQPDQRAYLGILYMEVQEGVMISEVYPDSPAERAGLSTYDLIISANGHPVIGPYTLKDRVLSLTPGSLVEIEVISRDGKHSLKKVVLEPMPKRFQEMREKQNQKSNNNKY